MNATKKAKLRELLDTLPEEEIERLIAQGAARTEMATKASALATRYKSQGRSVAAYKATPAKLVALATLLDLSEAELMAMDREQVLDAIEDLLEAFVDADDDEPVESESSMLPSANGMAAATKTSAPPRGAFDALSAWARNAL